MTTESTQQMSLGLALAELWQRHRQSNLDRISLLEFTTADILRGVTDSEGITSAAGAAHQLAGSLGTFGFDSGSRAALQAECLLGELPIDGLRLSEAVTDLRYSVEGVSPAVEPTEMVSPGLDATTSPFKALIISNDIDLASRLTAEATTFGMTMEQLAKDESDDEYVRGSDVSVLIDDAGFELSNRAELLKKVAKYSKSASVTVLSDNDGFDARMELVAAGADRVIARSLGTHGVLLAVAESTAQRSSGNPNMLTFGLDDRWSERVTTSLKGFEHQSSSPDGPLEFWHALVSGLVDLVVIGSADRNPDSSDVCRTLRASSASRSIPIVMVGNSRPGSFVDALHAGADGFLGPEAQTADIGACLRRNMERGHETRMHDTTDFSTGTANRQTLNGSLERLLRQSLESEVPFSLGLVVIDQFDVITKDEGSAMGAISLYGLAEKLRSEFGVGDVVGRWGDDGFGVGIYGCSGEAAAERVADVAKKYADQEFRTTSGRVGRYTISAGIASAPLEGSSVLSLTRVSESALQRARAAEDSVVVAGGRPPDQDSHVVDVVVVEDDDSVADVIEHALGLRSYNFLRFSDGAEAARVLGEGLLRADVVLLDVGLPSLDGFGVLQVLQSQGVLAHTKVIMLTARSSEAEMLRALGLGATEHITKPFSIPVLLGRLDKSVSRSMA